ncbi:LytTR family transcriptional regulator DNA-binding domain-containing protein [Geomonas sp. RF6]|uniref:PAS domain-containing transcriptional regulator n=1 Tax=Geomonas sp. RF6 TaxID=2897342 RepID=UPI001E5B572B|nr:PAS domain-containing transcriptional regulator [Geomonas sp. RF6]UFS72260.1 LytTR family transcriptional regulator DNA-binding domain-containing protein [Geomonas sp. RF6]
MDDNSRLKLLEHTDPGIILFDNDYRVTHVNGALMRIFAETPENTVFEQSLLEMHRAESAKQLQALVAMMQDSSRQQSIAVRRMSGAREIFVLLKFVPLLGPQKTNTLHCCLLFDITADISTPQSGFIRVPVTAGGDILLVPPPEILFIKADNIYSQVVTAEGEFFCDLSLGVLETGLNPQSFYRTHRSYVVNLEKVHKVVRDGNAISVQMAGSDRRLPVSRTRSKDFLARVGLK